MLVVWFYFFLSVIRGGWVYPNLTAIALIYNLLVLLFISLLYFLIILYYIFFFVMFGQYPSLVTLSGVATLLYSKLCADGCRKMSVKCSFLDWRNMSCCLVNSALLYFFI